MVWTNTLDLLWSVAMKNMFPPLGYLRCFGALPSWLNHRGLYGRHQIIAFRIMLIKIIWRDINKYKYIYIYVYNNNIKIVIIIRRRRKKDTIITSNNSNNLNYYLCIYLSIDLSIYLDGPWSYVSSQDKIYYPAMFGDYQNLTAFTWYIIIHIYI